MDSTLKSVLNSPALKNQIAIISSSCSTDALREVHQWFSDDCECPFVTIGNRYYETKAHLVAIDLNDESANMILAKSAVIVILVEKTAHIEACKAMWVSVAHVINTDIVCLFIVLETVEEVASYDLVRWALPLCIEVVTSTLCSEDGLSISQRAKDAIECATWPECTTPRVHIANDRSADSRSDLRPNLLASEFPKIATHVEELSLPLNYSSVRLSDHSECEQDFLDKDRCESNSMDTVHYPSLQSDVGLGFQTDDLSHFFDQLACFVDDDSSADENY